MSLFSTVTIKLYAESVGLPSVPDDILQLLCHDVEYRLRELLQEASKFMRHSHRLKLTTEDVNYALRMKNIEPIYGYDPSDVPMFRHLPQSSIYYLKDREIDFDTILTAPLPKLPHPMKLSAHWLAIEGIQPQIPENPLFPLPVSVDTAMSPTSGASSLAASPSSSTSNLADGMKSSSNALSPPSGAKGTTTIVKHHLSKEHQMYFETLTTCLLSKDASAVSTSLNSLKTDAGIQQLLPYFVQFISEMVMKSLRQLETLRLLLKALEAVLINPNFFAEPYLHQIMPTVMTMVVGKRLSESPAGDHWSLREDASKLVAYICKKYGETYPEMQPRILKTLLKALVDEKKSLPCKYGAIVCMSILGSEVVELFIIPNIKTCYEMIEQCPLSVPSSVASSGVSSPVHSPSSSLQGILGPELSIERQRTEFALLEAIGTFLSIRLQEMKAISSVPSSRDDSILFLKNKYSEAFSCLGDKLIPYLGSPGDSLMEV